jgi:hypothetical protein
MQSDIEVGLREAEELLLNPTLDNFVHLPGVLQSSIENTKQLAVAWAQSSADPDSSLLGLALSRRIARLRSLLDHAISLRLGEFQSHAAGFAAYTETGQSPELQIPASGMSWSA